MRKIILFFILFISVYTAYSQTDSTAYDTVPAYKKDPNIPPFQILQGDSSWFGKNDLPKKKPVIIIYFNPDCGHCQLTAQDFLTHKDEFKNYLFVWISYHSPTAIDSFAYNYHLADQSNMHFGRDTRYYIPVFYKIQYTPFIAIYDKKGKLLRVWDGGTDPEEILKVYAGKE